MKKTNPFSLYLDPVLRAKADKRAAVERRSLNKWILYILEAYLDGRLIWRERSDGR